jgi:hypothetical protein
MCCLPGVCQKRGFWAAAFTPNRNNNNNNNNNNKTDFADVMKSNIVHDLLFSQNQQLKFSCD